jgi:hypothetical protein
MVAADMKLNRARCTTRAVPEPESDVKKIIAPKILSNAATTRRYSLRLRHLQHLMASSETHTRGLPSDGQCRQEDRHQAILTRRQATQYKRPCGKAEFLKTSIPALTHQRNALRSPKFCLDTTRSG